MLRIGFFFGFFSPAVMALLAGAGFSTTPLLRAQNLLPALEGSDLSVSYWKDASTVVTAETSSDLAAWNSVDSRETLLGADVAGLQNLKTTVSIGDATRLFLRLRTAAAWDVELAWDPVRDETVVGYRLYYYQGESESHPRQFDVGNRTEVTVSLPEDGSVYSFVVSCYDADGLESPPSESLPISPASRPLH